MHFYTHNIGDFASQTVGMDLEQVGIFVRLLDRYVSTEKPISDAWISLAFPKEAKEKLLVILEGLFEETDEGWVYLPAQKWVAEYQDKVETLRSNGKKGGRPKKQKANENQEVSKCFSEESKSKVNVKATNNHKPITNIDNHINQSTTAEGMDVGRPVDVVSCFRSFGQNPVSAPSQWEPDEDDFDSPLREQITRNQKIEVDINDKSHVLTASEMVVLAATLGFRLAHNVIIDEIADERVITTGMMKEAIQRAKDNAGGVGYLVRILQNAVKDPDAFNGIRKAPDITAESLSDAQAYKFAQQLTAYHPWASNNAKYMETPSQMVDRVSKSIKDPVFFNNCRWALEKLGLVKEAQQDVRVC